jgi:glyceraldehyde-3-phosphate dehydrogenase/erythrose-4-phosphate dehydrogenase
LQKKRHNEDGSLKLASETTMKGVMGYTEDLVVSQDFVLIKELLLWMRMQTFRILLFKIIIIGI